MTPATPSGTAINGSTGLSHLSAEEPSNYARWSDVYFGTSTFDADIMRQGPYAYSDPNSAQDPVGFAHPARLPVAPLLPPPTGYANVTRPTARMPAFPWYSPEHTVTTWSNDNGAASALLEDREMHLSSHSSATDPRFY